MPETTPPPPNECELSDAWFQRMKSFIEGKRKSKKKLGKAVKLILRDLEDEVKDAARSLKVSVTVSPRKDTPSVKRSEEDDKESSEDNDRDGEWLELGCSASSCGKFLKGVSPRKKSLKLVIVLGNPSTAQQKFLKSEQNCDQGDGLKTGTFCFGY